MYESLKKYFSIYKLGLRSFLESQTGGEVPDNKLEAIDKIEQDTLEALKQTKELDQKMQKDVNDFLESIGIITNQELKTEDYDAVINKLKGDDKTEQAEQLQVYVDFLKRRQAELKEPLEGLENALKGKEMVEEARKDLTKLSEHLLNQKEIEAVSQNSLIDNSDVKFWVNKSRVERFAEHVSFYSRNKFDAMLSDTSILNSGKVPEGLFKNNKERKIAQAFLKDFKDLRDKIPSATEQQIIELFADKNLDGVINDSHTFGEKQVAVAVRGILEQKNNFDNLLNNIGYIGGKEAFIKDLKINPYTALKQSHALLDMAIARGVELSELVTKGGKDRSIEMSMSESQKLDKEIIGSLTPKNKEKYDLFDGPSQNKLRNFFKTVLKNPSLAVMTGDVKGVGVALDMGSVTNGFFDKLIIGVGENGIPVVAVTKELYNKNNFQLIGSLTIAGGLSLTAIKKLEGEKGNFNLHGTISLIGGSAGVNYEIKNQKTMAGIESKVKEFKGKINQVKQALQSGAEYNSSMEPLDLSTYNALKNVFGGNVGVEFDEMYNNLGDIYRNSLYQVAEKSGWNFSGGGAGIALAGPLLLPYISLSGQKIRQDFKEGFKGVKRQAEITKEKLGYEIMDLGNGIEGVVLAGVPNDAEMKYYAPPGTKAQFKRIKGNLVFGGEIQKVHIRNIIKTNGAQELRVFVDGVGENSPTTETSEINKSIDFSKLKKQVTGTEKLITEETIDETKSLDLSNPDLEGIKENITAIEQKLSRANRIGEVQKAFGEALKNGVLGENIQATWDIFQKYYKTNVKKPPLPDNLNDNQKIQLIQRVFGRFMGDFNVIAKQIHREYPDLSATEKEKLYFKKIGYAWDKNMARSFNNMGVMEMTKFDTIKYSGNQSRSRADSFSLQYNKEWQVDTSVIDNARNNLLNTHFEGQTTFGVTTMDNIMAFVASAQIDHNGKSVYEGITPMTGTLQVATGKNGPAIVEIPDSTGIREKMVAKLPDNYLNKMGEAVYNLTGKELDNAQIQSLMIGNEIDGVKIDYRTIMFKWGDCFNDAIGMDGLKVSYKKTVKTERGPKVEEITEPFIITSDTITSKNTIENLSTSVTGSYVKIVNTENPTPKDTPKDTPKEECKGEHCDSSTNTPEDTPKKPPTPNDPPEENPPKQPTPKIDSSTKKEPVHTVPGQREDLNNVEHQSNVNIDRSADAIDQTPDVQGAGAGVPLREATVEIDQSISNLGGGDRNFNPNNEVANFQSKVSTQAQPTISTPASQAPQAQPTISTPASQAPQAQPTISTQTPGGSGQDLVGLKGVDAAKIFAQKPSNPSK